MKPHPWKESWSKDAPLRSKPTFDEQAAYRLHCIVLMQDGVARCGEIPLAPPPQEMSPTEVKTYRDLSGGVMGGGLFPDRSYVQDANTRRRPGPSIRNRVRLETRYQPK